MEDRRVGHNSAVMLFSELLDRQEKGSTKVCQWLHSRQLSDHPDACLLEIDVEKALQLGSEPYSSLSRHQMTEEIEPATDAYREGKAAF